MDVRIVASHSRNEALPSVRAPWQAVTGYEDVSRGTAQTIGSLLQVLWRRKWLFIVAFVILVAPAGGLVLRLTPTYRSDSLLMVDPRETHVTGIQAVQEGGAGTADYLNLVRSEMQVLASHDIAKRVVEALNLQDDPEFASHPGLLSEWLTRVHTLMGLSRPTFAPPGEARLETTIAAYQQRFTAFNDARSFIIEAAFTASNPEAAQHILAAHIAIYLDGQRAAKQAVIRRADTWFTQELQRLHAKLVEDESAQQAFRLSNGLLRTGGQTMLERQLGEITTRLANARADLVLKTARFNQLNGLAAGASSPSAADTAAASSITIGRLREQETALSQRLSENQSRFGPNFPASISLRAAVVDIEGKIAAELKRTSVSAGTDAAIKSTEVEQLEASSKELQKQIALASDAELTFTQSARTIEGDQHLYADLLTRSKQVAVQLETQEPDARIMSNASLPTTAAGPRYAILGIVATTGAAMMAGLLTIGFERLGGPRIRSLAGIEAESGLPNLTTMPRINRAEQSIEITSRTLVAASCQALKNSLTYLGPAAGTKVVVFASGSSGEGKTLLSTLFARSLAGSGARVLLIDADLRRAGMSHLLGVGGNAGIANLLNGALPLESCLIRDPRSGLDVLAAGDRAANLEALLTQSRVGPVLDRLRTMYDMIIIDSPPVGAVDDVLPFAAHADATVLVVRWAFTGNDGIREALRRLNLAGANVVGTVLNATEQDASRYGSYFARAA